jgi:hypothetical protein
VARRRPRCGVALSRAVLGRPRLPSQGILSRCKSVVLRRDHRGASPAFICLSEQSFAPKGNPIRTV